LWGVVHITAQVYEEAVTFGHAMGAPDALTIRLFYQKHNLPIITVAEDVLAAYHPPIKLDPGEHAIFAHARTLKDVLVLVDDEDARTEGRRLGIPVRGTVGILVEAYRSDFLKLPEIEFLLSEFSTRPDIWISSKLCEQVLRSLRSE
jgi:predicted nucleic acid-binding protein